MTTFLHAAAAVWLLLLSGCVAPEQPEPARLARPVTPAVSSSERFESAPTPNRTIPRPAIDEVIRVAH